MSMKLNENNYGYYIYRNPICLVILLHFGYTLPMGILCHGIPLLYNICNALFYIGMLLLIMKKGRYALAVSLIHLGTICFVALHTVLSGWDASFFLFLIVMVSLVYFCPYHSPYIPYLFPILRMLTFFLLYEQIQGTVFPSLSVASLQLSFLCSNFDSFLTVLYVACVSDANADIGKEVLKKQNESLLQIANYGSLTGPYNRIYSRKTASQLCLESCCLAIGDIDDFKRINNIYDHLCEDAILKQLVEHIQTRLDPTTFICRWGGKELTFLFHDIREQDVLQQLQDFCHWINHTEFQYGKQNTPVTITSSICCHQRLSLDGLVNKADQLLYQGKRKGKYIIVSG